MRFERCQRQNPILSVQTMTKNDRISNQNDFLTNALQLYILTIRNAFVIIPINIFSRFILEFIIPEFKSKHQ